MFGLPFEKRCWEVSEGPLFRFSWGLSLQSSLIQLNPTVTGEPHYRANADMPLLLPPNLSIRLPAGLHRVSGWRHTRTPVFLLLSQTGLYSLPPTKPGRPRGKVRCLSGSHCRKITPKTKRDYCVGCIISLLFSLPYSNISWSRGSRPPAPEPFQKPVNNADPLP